MSNSVPNCGRCGAPTMWTFKRAPDDPAAKHGKIWILADRPADTEPPKVRVEFGEGNAKHVCPVPPPTAAPVGVNAKLAQALALIAEVMGEIGSVRTKE